MRKHQAHTDFACFVRNVTPQPVQFTVPFGQMEGRPRTDEAALQNLLAQNRERYAASGPGALIVSGQQSPAPPGKAADLEAPELL
jgi:hypothetical protein